MTLRNPSETFGRCRTITTAITKPVARRWPGAAAAVVMTAALAGCGSISEETARVIFAAPGKFDDKTCEEINNMTFGNRARLKDLDLLMARASQAPSGALINTIAYRADYIQVRGDLRLLAKVGESKQCVVDSKYSSGRAVF